MRPYPVDSPQAAARILALTWLADGQLDDLGPMPVDRLTLPAELGLSITDGQQVLRDFMQDLQSSARQTWGDACGVDPLTLQHLLAEVASPALRKQVLGLCLAAAEADGEISDGEGLVLEAMVEQWGLQSQMMGTGALA
jgi:hypothetical protein